MVSWKTGAALLVALIGLAAYLLLSRPQSTPVAPALIPCDVLRTVEVRLAGGGRELDLQRAGERADWQVIQPVAATASHDDVVTLVSAINSINIQNTLSESAAQGDFGLTQPRLTLTCRLSDGKSYNLTVGKPSFDGSGYYAQKAGDGRVYVISKVEVDSMDQALSKPPVQPTPSP
jgi:hypothetical protein